MAARTTAWVLSFALFPAALIAQEPATRRPPPRAEELASLTDELKSALQAGDFRGASRLVARLTSGIVQNLEAARPSPAQTLAKLEVEAATKTEISRFAILRELALTAYDAGDLGKATGYANELLALAPTYKSHPLYGEAIYTGNLVLGRIALRNGDIAGASAALRKAGRTPGSPFITIHGPDFSLAKELLAHGETSVVLEYLGLCRNLWKNDGGRLDQWAATIRGGAVPDFASLPRSVRP